jgi:hypothetical protein
VSEATVQLLDEQQHWAANFARILHGFLGGAVHVQDIVSVADDALHVHVRGGALFSTTPLYYSGYTRSNHGGLLRQHEKLSQ